MNRITISAPKLILGSTLTVSAVFTILRCVLTITTLDIHGLYQRGSVLPTVFHALLALSTVSLIAFSVLSAPKKTEAYDFQPSVLSAVLSIVIGFVFAVNAMTAIYIIMVEKNPAATFDILEIIFCIPSTTYFITTAVKPRIKSTPIILTSMFPIAWCALYLIRIYFDKELLMTDPGRILKQVALLAAMIALLTETRVRLGIFSHRFFLASSSAAAVLLLTSAVPDLLFSDELMLGMSDSFMNVILRLAFSLLFCSRIASYLLSSKHDTNTDEEPQQCNSHLNS